jgi:hypothetical protein
MERLTIGTAFVALFAGLLALTPTNVFKICAWNAGTEAVDPWRIKGIRAVRRCRRRSAPGSPRSAAGVSLSAASPCSSPCSPTQLAIGHTGVLAAALPLATLKANRATFFTDAAALKRADGTFENDEKRSAFDAKMTEVDALDEQIREAEAIERREAAAGQPLTSEQRQAAVTEERARAKGITDAVRSPASSGRSPTT